MVKLVLSVLLLAGQLLCPSHAATCDNPRVRREWRTLSHADRLEYINAIKCMMRQPPQTNDTHAGARSRFDDFQGLHIDQTDHIHWCAQFLPWHRYLMALWQRALTEECGFTGTVPYWNWALDATEERFHKSPVFDTKYGFGGNGPYIANLSGFPSDWIAAIDMPDRSGGGCIVDGPFANHTVNMGPSNHTGYTPHCLRRDFSPTTFSIAANQSVLDWTLAAQDFWHLDLYIQGNRSGGPTTVKSHGAGHLGVGGQIGEMTNTYSSPGDPLFYLHHGGVDWLWFQWQRADWPARNRSVGGPDTQWAYPYNYYGDVAYQNITLDTPLQFSALADPIVVGDVMDTEEEFVGCYIYE